MVRLVNAPVLSVGNGLFESVLADGLLPHKGNALVGDNVLRLCADKGAVDALDRQGLVVKAVGNLFVFSVPGFDLLTRFRLLLLAFDLLGYLPGIHACNGNLEILQLFRQYGFVLLLGQQHQGGIPVAQAFAGLFQHGGGVLQRFLANGIANPPRA